jgi:hypothetical protein
MAQDERISVFFLAHKSKDSSGVVLARALLIVGRNYSSSSENLGPSPSLLLSATIWLKNESMDV